MGIGIPLRSHSYGRDYNSELKTLFSNCELFLPGYHIAQGETVTWIGNHWDFWAQRLLLWVKNSELGWFKPLMFQVGKQKRKKERAEKKLPDDHTPRNDFRTEHILLQDSFPVPVTRMFSTSKRVFPPSFDPGWQLPMLFYRRQRGTFSPALETLSEIRV